MLEPRATDRLEGEAEIEKSGGACGVADSSFETGPSPTPFTADTS